MSVEGEMGRRKRDLQDNGVHFENPRSSRPKFPWPDSLDLDIDLHVPPQFREVYGVDSKARCRGHLRRGADVGWPIPLLSTAI